MSEMAKGSVLVTVTVPAGRSTRTPLTPGSDSTWCVTRAAQLWQVSR
jgi:hypothetical protein